MHELKVPHKCASLRGQCHDRIRPFIVARSLEPMIVGARTGGRDKDDAAFPIDRNHRPGVAHAGWGEAFRDRVPTPAKLPRARIKGAHDAAWAVDAVIVGYRGADNHMLAHNCRRRGFLVFAASDDVGDAVGQVDLPASTETGAWRAGRSIEGEEARINRRQEDAATTSLAFVFATVGTQRDAAIDEAFGVGRVQVDLRVEAPLFSAVLWVESDHPIERRCQIHRALDDDRSCLELALAATITAVGNIAGVVFRSLLQLCDIAPVDLIQMRIAAATGIAPIIGQSAIVPLVVCDTEGGAPVTEAMRSTAASAAKRI